MMLVRCTRLLVALVLASVVTLPVAAQNTAPAGADLAVRKTADTRSARVGDSVTYTITLTNRGPEDALNVLLGEGAPDELGVTAVDCHGGTPVSQFAGACRYGRLARGEAATMTVVATVTFDATPGERVTNTAFVAESSAPDPRGRNNQDEATIRIVA